MMLNIDVMVPAQSREIRQAITNQIRDAWPEQSMAIIFRTADQISVFCAHPFFDNVKRHRKLIGMVRSGYFMACKGDGYTAGFGKDLSDSLEGNKAEFVFIIGIGQEAWDNL